MTLEERETLFDGPFPLSQDSSPANWQSLCLCCVPAVTDPKQDLPKVELLSSSVKKEVIG